MITTLKSALRRISTGASGAQTQLPGLLKSLMPMVALAIGVTALVLMFFWRDQSAYKPVFGAREKVVAADMMSVLDAEHIPYRLHPDSGQVLVPDEMLGKVRMLLASKGVIARLPAGLELMDHNDSLGVSQFVQDVRFRRGLEGELTQSIMALDAVESARVHLSIAKSSSFVVSDGEKSSASVVLMLKAGRSLSPEQIAAVIHLVAGSVASLDPQRVSLVDQAGNLLSAHVDLSDGFDVSQGGSAAAKRFQDEARRNAHELLAPVLGEGNYEVSVAAEVDNDRIEETREQYGDKPKVTSEAMREESDRDRLALGIPGSLSNRPIPTTSTPSTQQAASGTSNNNTAQKNATTRQYAYDRNITQIKRSRGRLHKLNVAVVLNNAASPTRKGWSQAEMAEIERILRSGLGVDADRGDRLTVSALSFPAKLQPEPWWKQRDNIIDFGSWLVYLIGALLAFLLVVRPLLKIAQQRLTLMPYAEPPLIAAKVEQSPVAKSGVAAAVGTEMSVVPLLENYDLPPAGSPVDVMVDHLKVLASKEPERVAEVVKQWVQKNGRTG